MQIIIPMSGVGKRFSAAGYKDPKPLIMVDGMPIIQHVVNLFPGEKNIIFICNIDHLEQTNMREILTKIAPTAKIIGIPYHKKGPVFAVSNVFDEINDLEEVIINYCDFSSYWEYADFLQKVRRFDADGAIPAYRGFHPHMLGSTQYAFIKEVNQRFVEIKEKEPFTSNRMQEYASNGTYYFKRGSYVKKYFKQLMEEDINLNGEYYVSLAYNLLQRDGLKTFIYEVQHMLQWGTPSDLEEYQQWSHYFRHILQKKQTITISSGSINLVPLAGHGSRFVREGYFLPKPLIPVSSKPMVIQAVAHLPPAERYIFIALKEHEQKYAIKKSILHYYPRAKVLLLDAVTEGQACTCALGLQEEQLNNPLLIGACDNGMEWDYLKYEQLINDSSVDAIIWTFRHHPASCRFPNMYGWVYVDEQDNALGVSVKKPISSTPENDHAIVGTFYFRKAKYFLNALMRLRAKNIRINNEFYVDSCMQELIESGLKVKVFEVDYYVGWGTPNDLKTYEYWQSFFHKCSWHPYRLEKDRLVAQEDVKQLHEKYYLFEQPCMIEQVASCQREIL